MHIAASPKMDEEKRLKCRICGMPSEIVARDPVTRDSHWRCTHCYTGYHIAWDNWEKMTDQDVIILTNNF